MKFSIKHLTSLTAEVPELISDDYSTTHELDLKALPKLDWVPPMQRRRLSKFMKMALYCAHHSSKDSNLPMPMVFSSRHGDFHKTTKLLGAVSMDADLSPTDFSMSVHNAASGIFSILTENHESMNTVVAGKGTLFMAMIDAYARLTSGVHHAVLVVHCDQVLPEPYLTYADENQIDHALAFVMTLEGDEMISFSREKNYIEPQNHLPYALQFITWMKSNQKSMICEQSNGIWTGQRTNV